MKRVLSVAAGLAALVVLVFAPPASAQPSPDITSVRLLNSAGGERTGAVVTLRMSQEKYADIALNVAFEGFQAEGQFAFVNGSCPPNLVRVTAPAKVFECGWRQEGDRAVLRMSLRGTFERSTITLAFVPKAMIAPRTPGRYRVTVFGWSFPNVHRRVMVTPGPCADAGPSMRGDVICPVPE